MRACDQSSIFSIGGKFCPDCGLLLELHALTLIARSYVLLATSLHVIYSPTGLSTTMQVIETKTNQRALKILVCSLASHADSLHKTAILIPGYHVLYGWSLSKLIAVIMLVTRATITICN